MNIVILGLSITSSWGNGHATTYRALVKALSAKGHRVLFLERDVPWYAENRDLPNPPFGQTALYRSVDELFEIYATAVRDADLVMVGSYVPQGIEVGQWVTQKAKGVTAFYDIDTPVTVSKLARGECEYLSSNLIRAYHLYFSFTGGPTLRRLEREFGAQKARALYCSFDSELYFPEADVARQWDLGYLGTYSACRQPALEALMLDAARAWPAGKMVVAGPQYPKDISWPANVQRIEHLPPPAHRNFYNAQRYTLNVTRSDMVSAGHSPSVRLFEAAACGTPIISDVWEGLDAFFVPGKEIFISRNAEQTLSYLRDIPEETRVEVALAARARVLSEHTAAYRAEEVEAAVREVERPSPNRPLQARGHASGVV